MKLTQIHIMSIIGLRMGVEFLKPAVMVQRQGKCRISNDDFYDLWE